MDSPNMKKPPMGSVVIPTALQPWRGVLAASLMIIAILAGSAAAQTSRNAEAAHAQWRRLTQSEVNCVDQALRARNSNLWSLIQRGVGPSDPQAVALRAICRGKPGTSHTVTITTTTTSTQTSPVQPAQGQPAKRESSHEPAQSHWSLNGSTLKLVADGDQRKFYYDQVASEAAPSGAAPGALLLEGKIVGTHFVGTAYKRNSQCGRVPYRVDGMFRDNNLRLELQGQSPRIDDHCFMQGTEMASLTLKAMDAGFAKAGEAATGKPAVRIAAAGTVPSNKPAARGVVTEPPAAANAAVEKAVADAPAKKLGAEQEEKVVPAKVVAANGDVVQVAPIDKAEAAKTAMNEGSAEVTLPVTPRPAMDAAEAERGKTGPSKTEPAKTEPAKTEPTKAATGGEMKLSAIAAVLSADLDAETRLSFICGLLSGVATAGALALVFFARQRKRRAKAQAIAAAEDERARRGSQCQFDLLVRAVLAEQNRLYHATLNGDRATPRPEPGELVRG